MAHWSRGGEIERARYFGRCMSLPIWSVSVPMQASAAFSPSHIGHAFRSVALLDGLRIVVSKWYCL